MEERLLARFARTYATCPGAGCAIWTSELCGLVYGVVVAPPSSSLLAGADSWPQTWTRFAVKVAVVGLKVGARKNPLAREDHAEVLSDLEQGGATTGPALFVLKAVGA